MSSLIPFISFSSSDNWVNIFTTNKQDFKYSSPINWELSWIFKYKFFNISLFA